MLQTNVISGHLHDHLSLAHGVDRNHRLETNEETYLKRKTTSTLLMHLSLDGAALNAFKDRIVAAESRIRAHKPAYVSAHGLDLTFRCQTRKEDIEASGKREDYIAMLCDLRTELAYDGNGVKLMAEAKWGAVARHCEEEAQALENSNVSYAH